MRQRTEHQLDILETRVFGRDERDVAAAETGGRAALVVRGGEREVEVRMPLNEGAELAAGITARSEHAHWDFIHR